MELIECISFRLICFISVPGKVLNHVLLNHTRFYIAMRRLIALLKIISLFVTYVFRHYVFFLTPL